MQIYFHTPMHLNNMGFNLRTLEVMGFTEFYLYDEFEILKGSEDWKDNRQRKLRSFSSGAHKQVKWNFVEEPKEFLKNWSGRRLATIASHPNKVDLWDFEFKEDDLLVIGSESVGLGDDILECCTDFISIPQHGSTHSFNISVATGILLYEHRRQVASTGSATGLHV